MCGVSTLLDTNGIWQTWLSERRFHQRAGLAHIELAAVAGLKRSDDFAHVLHRGGAEFGLDRVDGGCGVFLR